MTARSQLLWARELIDALTAAGVREAVISPGSRSTPLVLAAMAHESLHCRTVIDERSAAFFALGQARVRGEASLLICTSGSAATHYYPAIIEAEASRLPLIVLSADRPPERHDIEAPQTIDQARLFGNHLRLYLELGTAESDETLLNALGHRIARAVHATVSPVAGPVQINAWLRKPFEDDAGMPPARRAPQRVRACAPRLAPDGAGIEALAEACREARRGIIVCGPAPVEACACLDPLERLSEATGMPLLTDATSQLRFVGPRKAGHRCEFFSLLERAGHFDGDAKPDFVLQIGGAQVLGAGDAWRRVPRAVIARHGWHDPYHAAQVLVFAEPLLAIEALNELLTGTMPNLQWARKLARADAQARHIVPTLLSAPAIDSPGEAGERSEGPGPSEAAALRALLPRLEQGSYLMLANSLPIREANAFVPGDAAHLRVLHQRGANGIEGLISGAAGSASIQDGALCLVIGDLAFLHDLGGLALLRENPATLVVLNNAGGRLFEHLPLADCPPFAEAFDAAFVASSPLEITHAARAFGIPYAPVRHLDELDASLAAMNNAGGGIIEIFIGTSSRQLHRHVIDALRAQA